MKPSIGRIVHYVNPELLSSKILPAIIVAIWSDTCVNLQVFTDGTNSTTGDRIGIVWVTSSTLDESEKPQPRTWHWPPRV